MDKARAVSHGAARFSLFLLFLPGIISGPTLLSRRNPRVCSAWQPDNSEPGGCSAAIGGTNSETEEGRTVSDPLRIMLYLTEYTNQ